ncbi:uncharacterized protein LOC135502065 isoform X3 [Lineus longissimus]|uniref:uncharacterized protein LOC135502065 isoform X3 n=1 Tax=Lineus longissimus TaxID=88925 RepID=UPI00315D05C0
MELDEKLRWLETRISSSLRPRQEELKNMFLSDENRLAFHEFMNNEDVRRLFVFIVPPRNIVASLHPPPELKSKSIFFLKTGNGTKLTKDNMSDEVYYMDCSESTLQHIDLLTREVFLPMLCVDQNVAINAGVNSDKLMDILHRLMGTVETTEGHLKGEIVLSLPSIEVLAEAADAVNRRVAVLHVLESTVISWIKQIKGVLKHDPVADLNRLSGKHPGPLDEVNLWQERLEKLQSINAQLDSQIAKDILTNLEQASSQYAQSFLNVRKDISQAIEDTNDNLKFLQTLMPWFQDLHDATDTKEFLKMFGPLVHTVLLVWCYSSYYHQKDKFANLLRVISNEVVHRAHAMVGEDILREPLESYSKLKEALRVCAAFRGTYLDERDKADEINDRNNAENAEKLTSKPQGPLWSAKMYGPFGYIPPHCIPKKNKEADLNEEDDIYSNSPWPPRNSKCFQLINSFMERCNDVLELVQTTRHFRLLADTAKVGGAGTKSLDALVQEVHVQYTNATRAFFAQVDDVLKIDGSQQFESAFFTFRTVVKDLERKLAEILRHSFHQCPTIGAQLRLLEVFEGISSRELVQANLKDKDKKLVMAFTDELIQVRGMFDLHSAKPPIHKNQPPLVSKMMWAFALKERIRGPMEKMKKISPHSLEGDQGWQVRDQYAEAMHDIEQYEKKLIADWEEGITAELTDRLKQPLLVVEEFEYTEEDEFPPPPVVHVNLDPQLVLLLREIHHLSEEPFNIHIPRTARELLRNTNAYDLQVTCTRLETIVSKYNAVMKSVTEVERPLLDRKLAKIDQLFEQGLSTYTWRNEESSDFIEEATALVCLDVHRNLDIIQTNCREITEITMSWSKGTLDVFAARNLERSYLMHELIETQKKLDEDQEMAIVPLGMKIHNIVSLSFEAAQISKASPAWEDYVDYLDNIVLDGLKQSTLTSLKTMLNTMVQSNLDEVDAIPILTIRLELIEAKVAFRPPLDKSTSITSVQESVQMWLDGFINRGTLVKMIGRMESYKDYLKQDEEVEQLMEKITKVVQNNAEECTKLFQLFKDYSFLWEQDVNQTFNEFLHGNLSPNPLRASAQSHAGKLRRLASARSHATSRTSSAKSSIEAAGVMGTAERNFLTPKNKRNKEDSVPSLDEFDSEIDIYKTARDEIQALQEIEDIGWLRVNMEPLKQVLITYAQKWMWTFTKYLSDQVTQMLETLDEFLKRIEPEIESITGEERDTASFMKMMRLFNEVSAQQSEMDGKFAAMRRTVLLLQKYGQTLPEDTEQLFKAAPGRWTNLRTKVSLAKQRLGPRIQEESRGISQDLASFGERVIALHHELDSSDVYCRDCSIDDAWEIIQAFMKRLVALEGEAQDLIELQELLEASVVNFSILPQYVFHLRELEICRHDLTNLKQLWQTVRMITEQQSEWKLHRWQKLSMKFLREETAKQLEIVRSLADETFTWDVYIGLHESIQVIQATLPLVDDLSNPAMRTRHWKQLVRVTGGALQIDNDTLKRMTFGELLGLGLQKHVEDVRAIVQRAVKDLSIENSLKFYEEVWLSKLFEMRQHVQTKVIEAKPTEEDGVPDNKSESASESQQSQQLGPSRNARATSRVSNQSGHSRNRRASIASLPPSLANMEMDTTEIHLLTNTDPIFDELENHQVSLQAMQSSSAAGSFLDEVMKWQKRLQTIEAVLAVWLEVQEKWAELEEIYSGTDVKMSLSHDATVFSAINRDFRLLMKATEKNPNVLQCCSRKNILVILEKMNNLLEHCRRSLLNHLERRRQKFPRFYFLSMEDVLHIVCNGYDINQVNLYMNKLLENVGCLIYDKLEDCETCNFQITGVQSALGEKLSFIEPVLCEGNIESWLPLLLQAMKTSLQVQLSTAMGLEKPRPKTREIHSAGARRVSVPSRESQREGSKPGSKPGSRQASRQERKSQNSQKSKKSKESALEQAPAREDRESKSWTLDHVTEIVYLVTQIQMTQQVEQALADVEGGNKEAIQSAIDKLNETLKATVLMLKGLEGEKEMTTRKEKAGSRATSEVTSQKDLSLSKEKSETMSESQSIMGRSQKTASNKGSMYDLTLDNQQATIPEEGSTDAAANNLNVAPSLHTPRSGEQTPGETQAPNEPATAEPLDTMNLTDILTSIETKQEEVEEAVDNSDVRLMLFPSQIQKISHVISILAHQRDLLLRLQAAAEDSDNLDGSFDWQSQLKYIFVEESRDILIKCMDTEFEYGFEYMGSCVRESISRMSEASNLSLLQAVKNFQGGLCTGPAGSPKLNMVQDLSSALGQPLYLFNCSLAVDSFMLHDIFKGMALTGCWACFNNLNRIEPTVLSVFAQLMTSVLDAMRAGKNAANLMTDEVQLNPNGAIFGVLDSGIKVTPSNPENLLLFKSSLALIPSTVLSQFRTVSVVKPDINLIVEVLLLSQGFFKARELAQKVVAAYDICRKLLGTNAPITEEVKLGSESNEGAHGWSLQTLRYAVAEAGAVLDALYSKRLEQEAAEQLMILEGDGEEEDLEDQGQDEKHEKEEQEKEEKGQSDDIPENMIKDEDEALVTALRNTFMPRLQQRDSSVFGTLLNDLWPDVEIPLLFGGADDETSTGASDNRKVKAVGQSSQSQNKSRDMSIRETFNLNTPVVSLPLGPETFGTPPEEQQKQELENIEDAIALATHDLGLLPGAAFQSRVAQLSQLNVAHQTILVVGPPACGKSEAIKTFAFAERERGKMISVQSVFTKAVESKELFGFMDSSKEWKDGLLPMLVRKFCVQPATNNFAFNAKPSMRIIQLDGQADPGQMEILESVLASPGAVVFGNNERLAVGETLRFIWETDSIADMSPSLMASAGVLFMDHTDVGWGIMFTQWLENRPEQDSDIVNKLSEIYINTVLDYLTQCTKPPMLGGAPKGLPQYKRVIQHSEINIIATFCTLFEALVQPFNDLSVEEYERYFGFAIVWAFAGTLEVDCRDSFSSWWRQTFEEYVEFPPDGTVFDYMIDPDSKEFVRWADTVPAYTAPVHEGIPYDAFVHTVDTEQISYLLGLLSDYCKPVMIVGERGCGKSSIVIDRIKTVCSGEVAEVLALSINTNRFTTARLLYQRLDERLEWKHGRTYVPKGNKRLMCLVDDLNLAKTDEHGNQTAVELVRQHIDDGGFYSPHNHSWRYVKNVCYVTTINPQATASIPKMSPRLLRHFAILHCPFPSGNELNSIYSTLAHTHFIPPETSAVHLTNMPGLQIGLHDDKLKGHNVVRDEEDALKTLLTTLVKVTVELQDRLRTMYLPIAQRVHYVFNMKTLSTIFRNLCLSLRPGCKRLSLMQLWQNECFWAYGARMINEVDSQRYNTAFRRAVKKELTSDENVSLILNEGMPVFSSIKQEDSGIVTAGNWRLNLDDQENKTDLYKPVKNIHEMRALITEAVEEYNKGMPKIKLSLYKSTIEYVCRLSRVISSPHEVAHSILVAEGCPGRTSVIVKLAAHLCGFTIFQIHPSAIAQSHEYKIDHFKNDLVQAYSKAGVKGDKILFLIHKEEMLDADFLVFIQEFIVTGSSISHLFSFEEQTTIINSIRTEVTQAGLTYTREVAWDFFLNTVRNNFRICFIATDSSSHLQKHCRLYPQFTQNMNFIWMPHWSKSELIDNALYHLLDVDWMKPVQRENIAHMLATMHIVLRQQDGQETTSGEYNHVTNTSYEKFVERFISLANARHADIHHHHAIAKSALAQIQRENMLATRLRKQLEHEKMVLEERKAGTVRILAQIGQDTAITEQQVKIVRVQQDKIKRLKKLLPEYQVSHERAVYKSIAIVMDTKKIITSIDPESLQELRSMSKPIIDIEDLMAAIIIVLKSPSSDLTWQKGAKRQMANLERFTEELLTFDDNQMPESTLQLVESYLKKPSFDPDTLERKTSNSACGSLSRWVKGVARYHRMMISKVKPLHAKVEQTTQAVDNAEHKMSSLANKRKTLEVRLADLAKGFEEATIDKNDQEDKTIKMDRMLKTSARLKKIIKGEHKKFQQIFRSLAKREQCIPGATAMAAGFLTYLGPYHYTFRRIMLTVHWPRCLIERGIPLVIDSISPHRGRVIEWSLDEPRATTTGEPLDSETFFGSETDVEEEDEENEAESVKSVSGKNDETGEEEAVEAEKVEEEQGSGNGENLEQDGNQQEQAAEDTEEKEPVSPKGSSPNPSGGKPDSPANQKEKKKASPTELEKIAEETEPSEYAESNMSLPMLTVEEYNQYVRSLIMLIVGELKLYEWLKNDLGPRQIENASMIVSSWQRPPFLIDPCSEGIDWLRWLNKLVNDMGIITLDMETREGKPKFFRSDPHLLVTIEKSIMKGRHILLKNCAEEIDSDIMPLIYHRNFCSQDQENEEPRMIKFCGRRILCHPQFRLFLATNLPKPKLSPDVASTTEVVNYGTSAETLMDDLLTRSFARIRRELYLERRLALQTAQEVKALLVQVIAFIKLQIYKNVDSKVLWNEQDVETIANSIAKKDMCFDTWKNSQSVLGDIDQLRDELFPIARRGATLYTVIRSLPSIRQEYQFTLDYFLKLFDEAVGAEPPEEFYHKVAEVGEDISLLETPVVSTKQRPSNVDNVDKERSGSATKQKEEKPDEEVAEDGAATEEDERRPSASKPAKPDNGEASFIQAITSAREAESRSQVINQIRGHRSHEIRSEFQVTDEVVHQLQREATVEAQDFSPTGRFGNFPSLPSEGVEYTNLSYNQIKQVVDNLTTTVYEKIKQSLYEEDRLLFATMMCLNIQAEKDDQFPESEVSLLTQGNPGLNIQLTLADFNCDAPVPTWLPSERWDELLSLSVLPGALANLCVNVAEDSEKWEVWYEASEAENELMPLPPIPKTPHTQDKDGDNTSRQSASPDTNQMSDLHQLIVIRMLRPDRLPHAMSKYVSRNLGLAPQPAPTLHDIMESMGNHHYGILVMLPPGASSPSQQSISSIKMTKDSLQTIREMAEEIGITLESVKMCEGCEYQVGVTIDQAEKNDGWVVIEDLHLAPEKFFRELNYNLIRVMRGRERLDEEKRSRSKFCIWLTSEPSARIPTFMLKRLHKLSWDNVTMDLIKEGSGGTTNGGAPPGEGEEETGSQARQSYGNGGDNGGDEAPLEPETLEYAPVKSVLVTAISSCLRSISQTTADKIQEMPNAQKILPYIYGLAVCQGVFQARQVFGCRGLSQWYPFNAVHLQQSIDILLKSIYGEEEPSIELVCGNISKIVSHVYGNIVSNDWDRDYLSAILNYIISNMENPSILLGDTEIPVPAANVELTEFGSWFDEQMKNKETNSAAALDLPMDVERVYNEASARSFIEHLDRLYETSRMDTGDIAPIPFAELSMFRLRSTIELCIESLPPLLELGDRSKINNGEESYNFPYHCPSVLSFSTASSVMMPESIGYVLLQECLWLNSLLCHIRQNIFELQQCLLTRPDSISPRLQPTAKSIQQENVPITWVHPNCQPCTHTLLTWLADVKKRYDQMYRWVKNGMVPTLNSGPTPAPRGQVRTIWLGGLVNPQALFMALRQEKAVLSDCLINEVELVCDIDDRSTSPDLEEDEAGVFVKDLHLQGASWDSGANSLALAESDVTTLPLIHVKAITKTKNSSSQDDLQKYNCPVFMNKARQVCSLVLPLSSNLPTSTWVRSGAALIIDPGIAKGSTKRTKAHRTMKQAQMALSPRIVDFESERGSTVSPLAAEKEIDKLTPSNLTASQQYSSQQSQLSGKPFTPKSSPRPPALQLERDEKHLEDDKNSKARQSYEYVSKESVLTDTTARSNRSEKDSTRSQTSDRYASKQSLVKSERSTKYSESFEEESRTDKQSRISERVEDDARSQKSTTSRGSHRSDAGSRVSKRSDTSRAPSKSSRAGSTDQKRYSARRSEMGSSLSQKSAAGEKRKESPVLRGSPARSEGKKSSVMKSEGTTSPSVKSHRDSPVGSDSQAQKSRMESPAQKSRTVSPGQTSRTESPAQTSRTASPAQRSTITSPASTGRQSKTGSVGKASASPRSETVDSPRSERTESHVAESPAKSAQPPTRNADDTDADDRGRDSVASSVISSRPDTVKTEPLTKVYAGNDGNTPLPPESTDGQEPSTRPESKTPSAKLY